MGSFTLLYAKGAICPRGVFRGVLKVVGLEVVLEDFPPEGLAPRAALEVELEKFSVFCGFPEGLAPRAAFAAGLFEVALRGILPIVFLLK